MLNNKKDVFFGMVMLALIIIMLFTPGKLVFAYTKSDYLDSLNYYMKKKPTFSLQERKACLEKIINKYKNTGIDMDILVMELEQINQSQISKEKEESVNKDLTKKSELIICNNCKEKNNAGAKFCINCGKSLKIDSVELQQKPAATPETTETISSPKNNIPKKPVVAVFPFKDNTGYENGVSGLASDLLINELVQGDVEVVTREDLARIMEEHKLNLSGMTNDSNLIKSGQIIGVKYIINGSVNGFDIEENKEYVPTGVGAAVIGAIFTAQTGTDLSGYTKNIKDVNIKKLKAKVIFQAKLIDVETGKIVDTQQGEGEAENAGEIETIQPVNIKVESPRFGRTVLGTAAKRAAENLADRLVMSITGIASEGVDGLQRCSACGTRLSAKLSFCTYCGQKLKQ